MLGRVYREHAIPTISVGYGCVHVLVRPVGWYHPLGLTGRARRYRRCAMALMIDKPLLSRVVGQASRRGLILRVPSGNSLLESVETWMSAEDGDIVRSTTRRTFEGGEAELSIALHPAAPPGVLSAGGAGRRAPPARSPGPRAGVPPAARPPPPRSARGAV